MAVVGAGPKALFCVERLISRGLRAPGAPDHGAPRVDLVVLDPAAPGEGAAYATDQTSIWRLNVTSAVVDVAVRDGTAPTPFAIPSLDEWRRGGDGTADLDPFPPRALVGRYLGEQWATVAAHLPERWTLEHRRAAVRRLDRAGARWTVDGEGFDEVLLATGHATDWPGALRHGWPGPVPLVPAVYPSGGLDALPARATVVVRGAALTFIDAALALTEGRGGAFAAEGDALRYVPGPEQAGSIVPVSRSGRFMVPKPVPAWVSALDLPSLAAPAAEEVRARPGDVDAVVCAVEATAGAYLARAGGSGDAGPVPLAALDLRGQGRTALALQDHDIAVAAGAAAPDATWALGQAWRDLYGALVASMSFESAGPGPWERFAAIAKLLEPIAFGPPLVNARKMQALGAAGVLDDAAMTGRLDVAQAVERARQAARPDGVDACVTVVDAVLPPPGITVGLLERAEADGLVVRAAGRRAVRIDPELACLDAAGRRIPGLSAVGRPTEDVILGNDTLNRALHDGPDRWARRLLTTLENTR